MRNFLPIFGRSPFGPIKVHMDRVLETARELRSFFDAFFAGDEARARDVRKSILKMEHGADLVKNEIREHLPNSYFLPVDRRDLLALLHTQDKIADLSEDVVVVATLKQPLEFPEDLRPMFLEILDRSLATCERAGTIVREIDDLREASFGGTEAEEVLSHIAEIGQAEHEVDKAIYGLAKELYRRESTVGTTSLLLWQKVLELVGRLANAAESVGDHIRLMLYR